MIPAGEWYGAWGLAGVTLAVAGVFGCRQLRQLLLPRSSDEAAVLGASARRRLAVSGLLAGCAVLIAWPYATSIADDVANIGPGAAAMTPEELHAARAYAWCWVAVAGLLLVALIVLAYDMAVVRRHWLGRLERLQNDRKSMIRRQLARYRTENEAGQGGDE
jgi:hypothetical protein